MGLWRTRAAQGTESKTGVERGYEDQIQRGEPEGQDSLQSDSDESFYWALLDRTYHESTRSFLARVAIFTLNDG